jgi:hypothetical protein
MIHVYDIETYINYFGVIFKNLKTKQIKEFIVYKDRDDLKALRQFILFDVEWLIGYNNFYFDNQLLNYICKDENATTENIYEIAYRIVNSKDDYWEYKYNLPFKSIDLMKIGNLQKSLKLVAVNLKWPKIQDLPIKWNNSITKDQLELLHDYNLNDVEITEALYYKLAPEIKVRFEIEKLYDTALVSESDSGIANRLMEKFYSEAIGQPKSEFKNLRTERNIINFSSVIFDKIIFFSNELRELLTDIKKHTYYKDQKFFNKNIIYDNVKYQLGIGGIHSVDKGEIFEADDENYIIDCDISSMYPTIIINNRIKPNHLDRKFIDKYEEIRNKRLDAKQEGRKVESDALKIVLNSVYGKFRNENHWLYDPLSALQVTINGQLYVLMLIEDLVRQKFKVISANTDGIITIVPKNRIELYEELCDEWGQYTHFDLEYTRYAKYIRKDVNNYIAVKEDGSTKAKGEFLLPEDKSLMQGYDKPIISLALRKHFLKGENIVEFIKNHKDIHDFCIAKKIDKKFQNQYHTIRKGELIIEELQQSIRYYVSTRGGSLYKYNEEEDTFINYCADKTVKIFNDYIELPMEEYEIDYKYYIGETMKIINSIKNSQLKLF